MDESAYFDPYRVGWEAERAPETWQRLAELFRCHAVNSRQQSYESFQHSDTDGALSQWASDMTANYCEAAASLAEAHGMAEFPALFDAATGELVPALLLDGKYGLYWKVLDAFDTEEDTSRKNKVATVSMSLADSRRRRGAFYRARGYTQGVVRARARAVSVCAGSWRVVTVYERLHENRAEVEVVDRDINVREENTATIRWEPGKKSASVVLSGRAVQFVTMPGRDQVIHAKLVSGVGGNWCAERGGVIVERTKRTAR